MCVHLGSRFQAEHVPSHRRSPTPVIDDGACCGVLLQNLGCVGPESKRGSWTTNLPSDSMDQLLILLEWAWGFSTCFSHFGAKIQREAINKPSIPTDAPPQGVFLLLSAQRAQYGLIKEYTSNHIMDPYVV